MPYIPQADRVIFEPYLRDLSALIYNRGISNGELNFLFTKIGLLYLAQHGTSYNTISDVVKALECAKLEFYTQVARPYEDLAKEHNGDVF